MSSDVDVQPVAVESMFNEHLKALVENAVANAVAEVQDTLRTALDRMERRLAGQLVANQDQARADDGKALAEGSAMFLNERLQPMERDLADMKNQLVELAQSVTSAVASALASKMPRQPKRLRIYHYDGTESVVAEEIPEAG
jgi:hypothetical protein